jgi:threonine dehydratase
MQTLEQVIRPTCLIKAARLSARLGCEVLIASETFQHTGSFKFRAAYNVVSKVPEELIITASSGNFGQAVAYSCKLLGKRCIVVMPDTSATVKIEAVREHGGTVDLVDVNQVSRAARVADLAAEHPNAYVASAYDDQLVIEGNATLGRELARCADEFDCVIVPVGGGGLASGLVRGFEDSGRKTAIFGAEPLVANDAARSFREGRLVANETEPQTLADGARTVSLGHLNWSVLRDGLEGILEVGETEIVRALQLLFSLANLKVEPTGALSIGALLTSRQFAGRRVCCVVSGGNVDPARYAEMLVREKAGMGDKG